ncbi:NAD-binding protein [Escherichia coli]
MGGFASSRILEVHGERMIKRTFNPGFKIALHQKDLRPGTAKCESASAEPAQTLATCQAV